MRKIRSVCVYCASSSRVAPAYFEAAQELGQLLARKHIRCVYGAGGQGLMGTLADAVMQEGGEITGVITRNLYMETVGSVPQPHYNTQHRRILRPIDRNARPGNRRILHAPRTPGHVVCRQNTARGHRYTIFRTRMGRETM